MSNVIKFPAALKMLAATSGCPSRLILGDEKISSRIIVDLKREIITITLTQVNTLYVHLPVVDIGDDVSRLENCGGGRVGLHSGDPNQQTTWVLSRQCWSWWWWWWWPWWWCFWWRCLTTCWWRSMIMLQYKRPKYATCLYSKLSPQQSLKLDLCRLSFILENIHPWSSVGLALHWLSGL